MTRRGRLASLALVATTLLACSGSSPGIPGAPSSDGGSAATNDGGTPATGTAAGTVGQLCSATAPCGSGLICAQSGFLLGRCTADCSKNYDLCAIQFGPSALCMNGSLCAVTCTGAADCPGNGECSQLTGGKNGCSTNPNGPPGAAPPPNGACFNVGGAFGDTVANGGYRCTPTTNGNLGTGIDHCVNGAWVSAYDCTCAAASEPSQCEDFTVPGGAQCSYGAATCAQCVEGAGCQ